MHPSARNAQPPPQASHARRRSAPTVVLLSVLGVVLAVALVVVLVVVPKLTDQGERAVRAYLNALQRGTAAEALQHCSDAATDTTLLTDAVLRRQREAGLGLTSFEDPVSSDGKRYYARVHAAGRPTTWEFDVHELNGRRTMTCLADLKVEGPVSVFGERVTRATKVFPGGMQAAPLSPWLETKVHGPEAFPPGGFIGTVELRLSQAGTEQAERVITQELERCVRGPSGSCGLPVTNRTGVVRLTGPVRLRPTDLRPTPEGTLSANRAVEVSTVRGEESPDSSRCDVVIEPMERELRATVSLCS